jgi:hypothetical protein
LYIVSDYAAHRSEMRRGNDTVSAPRSQMHCRDAKLDWRVEATDGNSDKVHEKLR